MTETIAIERVDHIGIRVRELERALAFYRVLGFTLAHRAQGDDVAIVRNEHGAELNLIFNANVGDPAANVLMDIPDKLPGDTHMALRVASIPASIAALRANDTPGRPRRATQPCFAGLAARSGGPNISATAAPSILHIAIGCDR